MPLEMDQTSKVTNEPVSYTHLDVYKRQANMSDGKQKNMKVTQY